MGLGIQAEMSKPKLDEKYIYLHAWMTWSGWKSPTQVERSSICEYVCDSEQNVEVCELKSLPVYQM